jgi:hypothetical protein
MENNEEQNIPIISDSLKTDLLDAVKKTSNFKNRKEYSYNKKISPKSI